MNEPIRVLHIFGALNPGGVETFVMNLYRSIDRSRVQFDFALIQGKKSFFDDEVLSLGGRIFYFDEKQSRLQNLQCVLKAYGPFAAVHSHVYFYSGLFLQLAKQHDIPVRIAHAHNTSFGQKYTLKRHVYEWAMRKLILIYATHMFGCSKDACEFVFGKGIMNDPRCSVAYNCFAVEDYRFDAESRARVRAQYGIAEDQFVVGHVGRFEEQKNHTQLVEQFAAIYHRDPHAVLLMVGRGSLMDEIREKCKKLGIADRCFFAGAQKDTPAYYSAMDVFLFPSLYEGLGSVLIEAQANGLACVTTSKLVPDEINVTGRACFVPLEAEPETWAEAVLSAPERERGHACNAEVAQKYDIRRGADRFLKVYLRQK